MAANLKAVWPMSLECTGRLARSEAAGGRQRARCPRSVTLLLARVHGMSGSRCGHAPGCSPASSRTCRRKATTSRSRSVPSRSCSCARPTKASRRFTTSAPIAVIASHSTTAAALRSSRAHFTAGVSPRRQAQVHQRRAHVRAGAHQAPPRSERGSLGSARRHHFVNMDGKAPPLRERSVCRRLHRELRDRENAHRASRAHRMGGELEDRRRCVLRDVPPALRASTDADRDGGLQPARSVPERLRAA